MLGVNAELAPNIGLEEFWSLHDSGMSKTHTRLGGVCWGFNNLKRSSEDDI